MTTTAFALSSVVYQVSRRWRAATALTTMLGLSLVVAPQLSAADSQPTHPPVKIEIRSSVDDLWNGVKKKTPEAHGKLYYVAKVGAFESELKLKEVVEPAEIKAELKRALQVQGYREITETETPDVLLTVLYGRGYLKNPYLGDSADEITPGPITSTLNTPKDAAAHAQFGFEGKLQAAQTEKLFIAVRAWKYPTKKTDKPVRLWQTTMIVDDPDHRDLNLLAREMLRAGAVHFDELLKPEGIFVSSDDPTGKVILAPLQVMESDAKATPQK